MAKRRCIPLWLKIRILIRDGAVCQKCGFVGSLVYDIFNRPVKATMPDYSAMHFDHIKPVSLGGENTLNNLRVLCPKCNLKKGTNHG